METAAFIGLVAGVLTSIASLPQLVKVIREKDVESLSWVTSSILLLGLASWVWYGFLRHDLPVILSNGVACLINCVLITCIFLYRKK